MSKLTPSAASKKQTPLLDDPVSSARYLLLRESDQVLLVNPATGEARKVEVDGGELQKVINVIQNGCELIGKLSDHRIVIIDLQGRIKSRILDSGWDQNIGPVFQESVSPNGKWMAYIVGRGVQGYDSWEKQDVQIINIAD
ncbi:MAG: hypothetical protein VB089_19185 [Anaerolineaceae bacterium]|nr:hypothetical protein [Anaerolineaceae bacterium]